MRIEQLHLPGLGHASYVVGADDTGEALVVDPQRDVRPYLDLARQHGWRIRWVADTHGHNDYLSGLCELVARTGATALGSAHADLGYPHQPVGHGDAVPLGEVGVRVLHTPGHTPEHLAFLLFDGEQDPDTPAALLSGGALLVGDLARGDLLGGEEEARRAAAVLCRSLQEVVLALPDHVLVYPTHVAGSLCGGSIGSRLVTTVGYERVTNPALADVGAEPSFVDRCARLDDLPAVPPYWPRMRGRNLGGVPLLGAVDPPPALDVDELVALRDAGHPVLDARSPEAFAGGHVPGAVSVGAGSSFPTWAGTVLPADAEVVLVLEEPGQLEAVTWDLLRIGYPRPAGWLAGGLTAWRTAARGVGTLAVVEPTTVAEHLEDLTVLDVRQPAEWAQGSVPGALRLTGAELPARLDEVPDDGPVAVLCGSGYRSTVVASLLQARGREQVSTITGGWSAWTAAGLPTTGA